jgi:hypothetical protein
MEQLLILCERLPDKNKNGITVVRMLRLHTCMAVCAMRRQMSLAVLTRSIMKSIIECVAGAPAAMPLDISPPGMVAQQY